MNTGTDKKFSSIVDKPVKGRGQNDYYPGNGKAKTTWVGLTN